MAPVFLRDELWGFVGFDDCHRERVFTDNEETILRSASLLIAHALLRNEMTLDIRAAGAAAQEASRAKSSFLSSMSHEIRTPLNAIIGMTLIGKAASTTEKKDYAFGKIESASSHLLGVGSFGFIGCTLLRLFRQNALACLRLDKRGQTLIGHVGSAQQAVQFQAFHNPVTTSTVIQVVSE